MSRILQAGVIVACCLILLPGCARKSVESAQDRSEGALTGCVAVLPAATTMAGGSVPLFMPADKSARHALQVMNEILSKELGGRENIRFSGLERVSSLNLTGGENQLDIARMVGKQMQCSMALETIVKRFDERVGTRYSVESPASVAFEMRLIGLETGSILWSAKFDETQKSVMENILDFGKARTRGFVWITAEELMREGVRSKLAAGPLVAGGGGDTAR
ncbi:MAG: hypothetical protein Kow0089_17900 [Desulfobulbaceae bacterium]